MAIRKIENVGNAKDFIGSQESLHISAKITKNVSLLEGSLFPKWVKAIYNYCMYTGDRVESLILKGYTKKEIARMSDYFHPMVYRVINTMYGYLFDTNFTITASGGSECGSAKKVQKNAEWYWRQKYVFKNMMRIIKQAVLLGQCRGMPYVELKFNKFTAVNGSKKKKEYIEDYATAGLHRVSPFHLFYDPHVAWEEQDEVSHCRNTSESEIKKELWFMTFGDGTPLTDEKKVNYVTKEEQESLFKSGSRFCEYDFSKVRQVWRQSHHNGTYAEQVASCLMSGSVDSMPNSIDNYKIEKSNEIHERTLSFRKVEGQRHLAVFINKIMIFNGPSPYGDYLPYVPVYYKEPIEGSVERGLGVLLEQPQEVTNNAYRAKNDSIRKNAISGSITVIQGSGTVKKNGKQVKDALVLEKDDVIQVGIDTKLSNLPVSNVNQDYPSLIQDANALGDYIANLNNVTGGQSSKVTRVSGEVITKTQVTQRELEPMIMGIEEFITTVTEIVFQQINQKVKKSYKVFIGGEDYEIDINDLKGRYSYTWSTSRIDELYREFNAQKKEAALSLILEAAPELVNREERAKEAACLGGLSEKIIMSPSDAAKFKIKEQRELIKMQKELLQDQLELEQERARLFPPADGSVQEDNSLRTNININYKDINNPTVKQEILAEAGAETAMQVDPLSLLGLDTSQGQGQINTQNQQLLQPSFQQPTLNQQPENGNIDLAEVQ